MESSNEIHDVLSTDSLTKMDPSSQKDMTVFNDNSIKIFTPCDDTDKTTTVGAISVISTSEILTNVTAATNVSEPVGSKNFSIKKYYSHMLLAFVLLFMIAVMLIPVILFYAYSPEVDSFLFSIDFQSCSVSIHSYCRVTYFQACTILRIS